VSGGEIVRALCAAIDSDDEPAVRALLDADLVSHGALGDVRGRDGFVGVMLTNVRTGFPDLRLEVADVIEQGDLVAFRLDGAGTHLGEFLGVAPTGRRVRIRGIHQVRIEGGRVIEHWQGPDLLAMLLDMGLFPPREAPRPI